MIEPGSGWPTDRATAATPRAAPGEVAALAARVTTLDQLDAHSSVCRACPRLVAWREQVAEVKRASYAMETYWGRPVTGWGPADAPIMVMGLAPAAHGGNRTGRIFTGDRSGDFLFAGLYRAGLATQATSTSADDGQRLLHTRITLGVRCAPPGNQPTPLERDTCSIWLARELVLMLGTTRAVVVLGAFAWAALWAGLRRAAAVSLELPRVVPKFGHGVEVRVPAVALAGGGGAPAGLTVLGCYHVSQQNTFTGRLTGAMLDDVLGRARAAVGLAGLVGGSRPGLNHPIG